MINDRINDPQYYDLGHGVNEAEALRQDVIFQIALIKINYPDNALKFCSTFCAY